MQSQIDQRLQAGMEQYYQPKVEGDIDLVSEVRASMLNAGLHQQVQAGFDTNRFIVEATGKTSNVQRHLLNRYFSQQLASSAKPSIEERYCLIPDGDVRVWLDLFQKKVLPFLMENNLPIAI